MTRLGTLVAGLVAFALAAPPGAMAQTWPLKPIAIVVPFPPGPGLDFVVRLVAEKLGPALGTSIVVENRPGANGRVAAEYVIRAAPDGYTLMAGAVSTHGSNVHLIRNLSYDPLKNFTPIITSVETIGCLVINHDVLPVNSIAELVQHAKANPGKLSYGSSGVGSFFHLAGELFNQVTGVRLGHVPYRGSTAAFTDLVGGHIQINFTQLAQALAYSQEKKLKILALIDHARFSGAPDMPSITEFIPAYRMPSSWNGLLGPAGLPEPIVQRINAEAGKALNTPDVKSKLEGTGYRIVGKTPAEFAQRIADDIEFFGRLIRSVGIQPE